MSGILRDKTSSKFQFKTFTYDDLKQSLIDILDTNILSKLGEQGLETGDVIFAGKGTLYLDIFSIVGFSHPDVWQQLNRNGDRTDFGQRVSDDNLTVIVQKLGEGEALFLALPSQILVDLKKMNRGFYKLGA